MADLVESHRDELRFARRGTARALLCVLLLVLVALPLWAGPAGTVRATLVWVVAIGVLGQNVLIGYAGQVSFGQAGFLAVGAYVFAHLRLLGMPFAPALAVAGAAAALAGLVVGLPCLRLKGPYLAIATLAFTVAAYQTLAGAETLSGGRAGLAVPRLELPSGIPRAHAHYWLAFALAVVFAAATFNLVSSWVGRALVAVRDSDVAAESMGVDLTRTKLLAFALSSFYTGMQGAVLAQVLGHLEPQGFTVAESVTLFVAVIVGGLASVEGALFGAAFVVLSPALVGGLPGGVPLLFGLALIVVLVLEPHGLAGRWLKTRLYFQAWPFR